MKMRYVPIIKAQLHRKRVLAALLTLLFFAMLAKIAPLCKDIFTYNLYSNFVSAKIRHIITLYIIFHVLIFMRVQITSRS